MQRGSDNGDMSIDSTIVMCEELNDQEMNDNRFEKLEVGIIYPL